VIGQLQGVHPNDLEVTIHSNQLTIAGVKRPGEDQLFYQQLFGGGGADYGWFEQKFQIPPSLDADSARAEFKKGILVVTFQRKQTDPIASLPSVSARPRTAQPTDNNFGPRFGSGPQFSSPFSSRPSFGFGDMGFW